jgi:hypothetical protein
MTKLSLSQTPAGGAVAPMMGAELGYTAGASQLDTRFCSIRTNKQLPPYRSCRLKLAPVGSHEFAFRCCFRRSARTPLWLGPRAANRIN